MVRGETCDYSKCSKHYRHETCKQLFEYDKCMEKYDKTCRGDMLYHSNLKGKISLDSFRRISKTLAKICVPDKSVVAYWRSKSLALFDSSVRKFWMCFLCQTEMPSFWKLRVWTPYYRLLRVAIWLKHCPRGQAQTGENEMRAEEKAKVAIEKPKFTTKESERKLWRFELGRGWLRFSSRSSSATM